MSQRNDSQSGMTLRDYFAAAALQGLIASPGDPMKDHLINAYARTAYQCADAMLRERNL